ncbi:YfhO family protein [Bianquea renquensis]|uniref:YfhO family protein n=1 Tax=Bianquea renquensis TaxID=2763661 RepID=A0A926I0I0_9FIRM|nr:YfhO family protein [Bianquea renquensis]MBC8541956.1 YfhO family protein [Bianquea renquensis]
MTQTNQKSMIGQVFLISLITAMLIFVPAMIWDKGYFLFLGDFNSQQIPFYKTAHAAVRSGNFGWNWYTDLGANFVSSYSFYLLGSPFFWLTIPFPNDFVPYLIGPLLILKFACAAATSYVYLAKYVKHREFAVIGGLLYAFSGFSIYNIFFNHFHEVMVLFPLLLIGLDEFMDHNTKGVFALAVFLNAMVNYFFFFGEVIFVILYFFIRLGMRNFTLTWKKFLNLAFEAVLGFLMSFVLMVPSVITVLQNPRVDNPQYGFDFWLYSNRQRLPAILASLFFPPELPSRPVLIPDANVKWTSLSAYLPLFSMSGVLAFMKTRSKSWIKTILVVLVIMALVPGLNSLFYALNASYYARWFYMLTLMLILATVLVLDRQQEERLKKALSQTMILTVVVLLIIGLTPQKDKEDVIRIGLYEDGYLLQFIIIGVTALGSLLLLSTFVNQLRKDYRLFAKRTVISICIISVIYGNFFVIWGKTRSYDTKNYIIPDAIEGADKITIPDKEEAIRIDTDDSFINMGMFWEISCMRAFHSIIPVSIIDFYTYLGEQRSVSSKISEDNYAVRSLLSVHWYFDRINVSDEFGDVTSEDPDTSMPGYRYYDDMAGYHVWENEYYIPMGFTYDAYVTEEQCSQVSEKRRAQLMLKAIVLSEEQAEKYGSLYEAIEDPKLEDYSEKAYFQDCLDRREETASSFIRDNDGFEAVITIRERTLVFFSVPWEEGWTAEVNGEEVDVERVNKGFMAVEAPAGTNTIRFHYRTPGLKFGGIVTIASILVWGAYVTIDQTLGKKRRKL